MDENCIFCRIINQEKKEGFVFEDNLLLALNDIKPSAPIDILILTKKHIPTIDDIEESDKELIGEIFYRAKIIAREKGLSNAGYRLVFNVKSDGGQEINHIHLHLIGGKPLGPFTNSNN